MFTGSFINCRMKICIKYNTFLSYTTICTNNNRIITSNSHHRTQINIIVECKSPMLSYFQSDTITE